MVGLEEGDEPEEKVDVEEEEEVGEEERVVGAPCEDVVLGSGGGAEEGELDEDGRERDEAGNDNVGAIAHHMPLLCVFVYPCYSRLIHSFIYVISHGYTVKRGK